MRRCFFFVALFLGLLGFLQEGYTSLLTFLKPIELKEITSGLERIDGIYVINLKERPERWELVESRFLEHNIRPNRFDAVNGWKIPKEEISEMVDPRLHRSVIIGGEIGCMLSHLSIYQDALERGFHVIWVCEDDIKFNRNIHELPSFVEELFFLDPDWDLLYTEHSIFGATLQRARPEQKPYTTINQDISLSLARTHGRFGTHSMIISRKGLEKILSYYTTRLFWCPIDIDLHYIGLKEYSIKKGFTTIESRFPSDTQSVSSLRNSKN